MLTIYYSLTQESETKLEIAADLVPLETALETITAPQKKLVFLLHPLMGLPPIESTHRIHRACVGIVIERLGITGSPSTSLDS